MTELHFISYQPYDSLFHTERSFTTFYLFCIEAQTGNKVDRRKQVLWVYNWITICFFYIIYKNNKISASICETMFQPRVSWLVQQTLYQSRWQYLMEIGVKCQCFSHLKHHLYKLQSDGVGCSLNPHKSHTNKADWWYHV